MPTPTDTGFPLTDRPKEPSPEQFGLASGRILILRERVSSEKIWGDRRFWIGHVALTIALGVAVYQGVQSVTETALIMLFGFFPYSMAVGVLLMTSIGAFNAIWRRFQPDYGHYVRYMCASANYRLSLFHWLRLQDFWWQTLDGRRFEIELATVLARLGYGVTRTGGAGDGGVDLVLSRAGREVLVQCKAHKNLIGPGPVRDLYGTMTHRHADEAWLVTASGFSRAAKEFAQGKGIRLLRIRELLQADQPLDSSVRGLSSKAAQ